MIFYRKLLTLFLIVIIGSFSFPHPSHGITIKQEKELSKKVIQIILERYTLIEDPIIVDYLRSVAKRIVSVLPPQPYTFRFYVIHDDQYNAFATPGGYIFFNSGMISAFDSESELAGVLAHEIAHVVCRHISKKVDRSKKASMAALAGIAVGALLGASGAPEAGQAVSAGAAAASQSAMLAYSREDEIQADQLGLTYLEQAGYGGKGLMTGLEKIRSRQWYGSKEFPTYLSTHPASEDRIAHIDNWLESEGEAGKQTIKTDPYPFRMAQARLVTLYGDETIAKQKYQAAIQQSPDDLIANYGYALILAKTGDRSTAIQHLRKALEKRAFDPYFLTEIGRIYYLQGQYQEAVNALEGAVSIKPDFTDGIFYLAKTYMDMGNLKKATPLLQDMIDKTPNYKLARYALAEAYGKQGEAGQSHYHLGLYYLSKKDHKNALFHLKRASKLINNPGQLKEIEKQIKKIEAAVANHRKRRGG